MLAEFGDSGKLLAGGHSLLPVMKLRLAQPEHLIDITGIDRPERRSTRGRCDRDRGTHHAP